MKVVLFDIDGTLVSTQGAGKRAMEAALLDHFGTTGPADYRYDGKTDRQIVRELMRAAGFDDATVDARCAALLDDYVGRLHSELARAPDAVSTYVGVMALLDALEARPDVTLGLLTGNVEPGAQAKLRAARLAPARFRLGAYGSDHERRDALPAIALERAVALLERDLGGDQLVIVGDTPNDVTCGRGVGARAVAVATGHYPVETLGAYSPAAVFETFADTEWVVEAILGD